MVFKRYIKKKGKVYGPYYYESYREDGKVKSRFLGMKNPSENRVTLHLLTTIIIALLVFGILFSGIRNDFFGEIKSIAGKTIDGALEGVKFLKNDNEGGNNNPPGQDGTPPGQENPPGQETPPGQDGTPPGQDGTPPGQDGTPPGQENKEDKTPPGQERKAEDSGNGGGKSSAQIEKEKKEKEEKERAEKEEKQRTEKAKKNNVKIIKKTQIKKYVLNESEGNLSVITSRDRIVVGNPVRWTKNVSLSGKKSVKISLPEQSENVTVEGFDELSNGEETLAEEINPSGEFFLFGAFKRAFAGITGDAVGGVEDVVEVSLDGNSKNYIIKYYTPAPEKVEKETSYGKEVAVSGPEELNYTNVLAFSNINESFGIVESSQIQVYWAEENSYVEFNYVDGDNNGIIDYVDWNVLHLSNQTFNIILISRAEHLDENRSFVGDVYDFVKERDNNWTEPIPAGDYLRVSFEMNLTSDKDITIYARSAENGSVQVYEKDEDKIIADFGTIQEDEKYKIYLTNLNGSQDVFDLKIFGGSVEFDYVVDPLSGTGTLADPYLITNCTDLQQMNDSLGANYSLTANIDCSDTINWNNGAGFEPAGIVTVPFVGRFNGKGNNISGLNINRTTIDYVGLFGYVVGIDGEMALENVGITDVNISGNDYVGGLVGYAYKSSINNSHSAGSINGEDNIGGLVGYSNLGSVNNSYSTGIVNGSTFAGGLVGRSNLASIDKSYATGNVTGMGGVLGTGENAGGLVGGISSGSFISNSYATGNIIATGEGAGGLTGGAGSGCSVDNSSATGNVSGTRGNVGGLVGTFEGVYINNSHATGNVLGVEDDAGGLVGYASGGSIVRSYATGNVSGAGNFVGGLAGSIYSATTIWKSYATGNVSGSLSGTGGLAGYVENSFVKDSYANGTVLGLQNVGGLVGYGYYSLINNSYATGNVNGTDQRIAGLVGFPSSSNVSDSFVTGKVYGTGVGEIVGVDEGDISNCYWYNNTDDDATSCVGGGGADACENNGQNDITYFYDADNTPMNSWDFSSIWKDSSKFPILAWQNGSEGSVFPATVATIISPTANTYVNSPIVPIDVKVNNSGICNYTLDLGTTNTTLTANASATGFTASRTFSNGAYSFYAYCIDDNGQKNYTTSVNFSVSYTAPVEEQPIGNPPVPAEPPPESIEPPACIPSWECSDWSSCSNGQATRSCSDANSCGSDSGKPSETQICELSCTPNVQCSDWSECNYVDEVEDIITGEISVLGYKEKICSDLSSCIEDYSEREECQTLKTSEAKITEETIFGEQTLIVRDAGTGSATTSINIDALKKGKLEISFVQGEQVYSYDCFDGIKNGNETQIDCGGSCKKCPSEKIWSKYINMWPWLVLIGLIIALAIYTGRELEEDRAIKRYLHNLNIEKEFKKEIGHLKKEIKELE